MRRRELLRGPLFYVVTMSAVTMLYWRTSPVGVCALALMCGGDGEHTLCSLTLPVCRLCSSRSYRVLVLTVAGSRRIRGYRGTKVRQDAQGARSCVRVRNPERLKRERNVKADGVVGGWDEHAQLPFNRAKSWAGSVAMFVGGLGLTTGFIAFFSMLGYMPPLTGDMLQRLALVALTATVVEALPANQVVDDNISVPIAALLMGSWLL
jgi:hypothetical protein